ncbi:carboxyltransferase domain-containing protein [Gordonia sp. (in: high G+C Gram-positive bacteria)]|uniref:5-oxoprolinase subunit B family protein n=1 Tax=Gordonia sp. (in: high G+C Gram-positive bacteria) TaxID=84139 RepID=UPI00260856E5|nr:carboxyltransferase domain-containing protein [Gordonia sp. (in: high G+C Gram-positive bacteria)]
MRELPAGDDAVLLDFSAEPDPAAAAAHSARVLRAASDAGILDVSDAIPAAATVLVSARRGHHIDALAVRRVLRSAGTSATGPAGAGDPEIVVPVTYDGADLGEVAALAGVTPETVISAHCATVWRVQFMGFAPGFGYLVPDVSSPADARAVFDGLTRRAQSRPAVPTGSVAVAAGYSAVYPRTSPGGWFLLGHTDIPLWDVSAEPPALLTAGATVRFSCAG